MYIKHRFVVVTTIGERKRDKARQCRRVGRQDEHNKCASDGWMDGWMMVFACLLLLPCSYSLYLYSTYLRTFLPTYTFSCRRRSNIVACLQEFQLSRRMNTHTHTHTLTHSHTHTHAVRERERENEGMEEEEQAKRHTKDIHLSSASSRAVHCIVYILTASTHSHR